MVFYNIMKFLDYSGLITLIQNLDSRYKHFIGTMEEYDKVAETIADGTIIIITDDELNNNDTTSVLGLAILGKMILGNE